MHTPLNLQGKEEETGRRAKRGELSKEVTRKGNWRTKAEEKNDQRELSGVKEDAESCRKGERPSTVKRDEGEPAKRDLGD